MSAISFDTLQYREELVKNGFTAEQADSITKANSTAFSQLITLREIATKHDIQYIKTELQQFILKSITTTIMILTGIQTLLHFIN